MSGDIPPLNPVAPTPLVREKRHYPGEHKDDQARSDKESQSDKKSPKDEESQEKQSPDDGANQNPMNTNEKNGKVGHIDEYA
ncbi:MAG: hypothetical protein GY694_12930 [Gammaproteobacteria bacterium]|nr:hypothetical protein [Gammaproteobacteria bacterium]